MSLEHRIIWVSEDQHWRILECVDTCADLEDLKGDVFNPKGILEMHGPEMTVETLKEQEREFEDRVQREGVFGYVLERWNPLPDQGWEHVDSCFGFVGSYTPHEEVFNHYIVEELKGQAK